MNPTLLLQLIGLAKSAIDAAPHLVAEYKAIKAAGSATPEQLDELKAQIEAMDASRMQSWAEADDALDAAAKRGGA